MDEKTVERKLVMEVKKEGGLCPKFVSPGLNGVPDRLALLPDGKFGFVEVKRPGEKPRKLQVRRHLQLQSLGYKVFVLDDPREIHTVLKKIKGGKE